MFKTDKSCFGEIGWSLSGALQTKIEEIWFLSIGAKSGLLTSLRLLASLSVFWSIVVYSTF